MIKHLIRKDYSHGRLSEEGYDTTPDKTGLCIIL